MKKNISGLLSVALLILLLNGCGGKPGSRKATGTKAAQEEKAVPVMVEKLQLADLEEYISFTAKLEGITDIYLLSESSGKVIDILEEE